MAISEEGTGGMYMPVAPAYGGGNNGFGGDWAWIILLLLLGWGNNGFGGNGNGGLYPWLNNSNQINDGFRDQMINTSIYGIQNSMTAGFGDVQNSLCAGFAGVNAAITNAQMADLERSFAAQTAVTSGLTGLSSQLANCCCENRAATQDLKYTLATEACATRANATANTQAILDKLCTLEIDGLKKENDNLRTQLNMANLAASQNAQTAAIVADNTAQTQYLINRIAPYPVPSYSVANPNAGGCGCGCVA